MKSTFSVALLALIGAATSTVLPRSCPESSQFGVLTATPTNLKPGETFSINADFTCAVQQFNIVPKYLDYYIEVLENSNNGHEPPILLARRQFSGAHPLKDHFRIALPRTNYVAGAPYVVQLDVTYPINGTDGKPVFIQGGTEASLNITS
ncbi:hypothetical protein SISSUDRAFT_1044252 [Sistotremastrum suecicum HHB10207 ss-3]|uniref:Phosphatidylglycerol/phosphatidylinositol transfer protein n=1 Tax=Sistotremastrum suecicum HHB10207 ss-3 TaxID=1314776 RepID=A0A166F7K0_9AGAM|nr:hypothetical protein SISSUDRAFT_1044252 [Sistotremastrum suecicum HHB10207 ss-3]